MKTYWIDFSGYCEIEANSAEEAEEQFWAYVSENIPLPHNIYECEGVEEKDKD